MISNRADITGVNGEILSLHSKCRHLSRGVGDNKAIAKQATRQVQCAHERRRDLRGRLVVDGQVNIDDLLLVISN
jgi:hypothetical protein